jgi:hypothetical protein
LRLRQKASQIRRSTPRTVLEALRPGQLLTSRARDAVKDPHNYAQEEFGRRSVPDKRYDHP